MRKIISSFLIGLLVLSFFANWQVVQASSSVWSVLPARQNKIDSLLASTLKNLQPGDKVTFIVTLNKQVDLSQVNGVTRAARSQGVLNALQATANATQGRLTGLLNTYRKDGLVDGYISFWIFNGFSVTGTVDVINSLANDPDVWTITPDDIQVVPAVGAPEPNISLVNAPALWSMGNYGQNVVVASMDSGVDVYHPDLAGRYRGGPNSWFDPYGQHPTTPIDLSGHGTQTTGIMVGGDTGGTSIGVAPGAQWIAVKIFNDQGGSTATAIHQGYQWLLDPDGNPLTDDAPSAVNTSWTFANPGCNTEFEADLASLRAVGILPVFAAGNGGPYSNTSYSPANNPSAFAVGAVDNNKQIYAYSSRGPSACTNYTGPFPKLVAPGVSVRTTDLYNSYYSASGTSYSSPHVAGALALLLSAYPNLSAADQEQALTTSAFDLGASGPDDVYGYGFLDILSAYDWVVVNPPPTPTPSPTPSPSPTPAPNINLALNQPVTVSTYQDSSHNGGKAVDGDLSTLWQTQKVKGKGGPSTEWIEVDLGSTQDVSQVIMEWSSYYATKYNIQTSADHTNWSTVFNTTSGNGGNDTVTFSTIQARYVRMVSTGWNSNSSRNWLNEFGVYPQTGAPDGSTTPEPTPSPGTSDSIHVADLDASSVANGGRWNASVSILVHDSSGNPVQGVAVSGAWSSGTNGSGSCTTDSSGVCNVTKNSLKSNVSSVTFSVSDLSLSGYIYQSSDNSDTDGDSNGTTIQVARP